MTEVAGFNVSKVKSFEALAEEFYARISNTVYCTAASIDAKGRPRLRVLHPIWEDAVGWFFTYPDSPKVKHLALNEQIAMAYTTDPFKPVYIDGVAQSIEDVGEKQRIWEYYADTPPPYGCDLTLGFPGSGYADLALIRVIPQRIEVYTLGVGTQIWYVPQSVTA